MPRHDDPPDFPEFAPTQFAEHNARRQQTRAGNEGDRHAAYPGQPAEVGEQVTPLVRRPPQTGQRVDDEKNADAEPEFDNYLALFALQR